MTGPGSTPPPPSAGGPVVAWEAPPPAYVPPASGSGFSTGYAGEPPAFTTGRLLSDCFAIYGADPLRFFVIAVITSAVSLLGSLSANPLNPTALPPDTAGLLGVLGFVIGVVGGSVTLALADGGPSMPAGRVVRRGVERAGWMFLTSLIIGLGAVVLLLIPLIVIVVIALFSPLLAVLLMLLAVLALVWLALRVALAMPANVADNLNSIDAIRLSWRVTSRVGVWARVLAAGLVLGVSFLPALGGLGFAAVVATAAGQPALLVVVTVALAVFTPIASLLTYAAYRRLVAPIEPWWAAPPAVPPVADAPPAGPLVADEPPAVLPVADAPPPDSRPVSDAEPPDSRPVFRPRPFGTVAKGLLAVMLAADVAGVVAGGWAAGELASGRIQLPTFPRYPGFPSDVSGRVDPGTVAFGTAGDLDTCTVTGRGFAFASAVPIVWMAAFDDRVTTSDEVFVRVTRDGAELDTTLQDPGTYDCLGAEQGSPLDPGIYEFQVIVNGGIEARGTIFVQ